jgi:hypothetical protein
MWDEKQQRNVADLLRQFNGADEVCAVTGCSPEELDDLSMEAFKCSFEQARSVFAAQGRAMVRQSLMQQALDGNMKAIDMICRNEMGMGPVESRARNMARDEGDADVGEEDGFLALIRGRARKPA